MDRFFVPYNGKEPALVNIKGHRLLMVSFDEEAFHQTQTLHCDHIRVFREEDYPLMGDMSDMGEEDLLVLGGDDGAPEEVVISIDGADDISLNKLNFIAQVLSSTVHGSVVFVPPSASVDTVVDELEQQLP